MVPDLWETVWAYAVILHVVLVPSFCLVNFENGRSHLYTITSNTDEFEYIIYLVQHTLRTIEPTYVVKRYTKQLFRTDITNSSCSKVDNLGKARLRRTEK